MNLFEAKKIIGVMDTDTPEQIKKKYHVLILKYHPDKCKGDNTSFIKINESYTVVNNNKNNDTNLFSDMLHIFKDYLNKKVTVSSLLKCEDICLECAGSGYNITTSIKLDKCVFCKGNGVIVSVNLDNFFIKDNKVYSNFDITLKESLVGFNKIFTDPFGNTTNVVVKDTLVKQNDGYKININGYSVILLFNIIYPRKISEENKIKLNLIL